MAEQREGWKREPGLPPVPLRVSASLTGVGMGEPPSLTVGRVRGLASELWEDEGSGHVKGGHMGCVVWTHWHPGPDASSRVAVGWWLGASASSASHGHPDSLGLREAHPYR